MENKQYNRQSSVPPKGPASDGRKDHGSHQKHQRQQKRRDSAPRARNESAPGRKSAPQRSREFDKRPRSRGYNNDKQREQVTQERRAELGSALRPGSKKGNLNHLLNFTFAPRDSGGRGSAGWKGRSMYGKAPRYNKERYLQANCQFVVRDSVDYSLHAADPDTLVDWDLIEQVRIFSHEVPSCPICLYPPNAAKLTRCGHIYCWSCILHYLSLEDQPRRKCPICYESIHKQDLKSVSALETHPFASNEKITMKLMKRARGSTYGMPRTQWSDRSGKPHNLDDTVDVTYAKLLVANCDQVQKILDHEKNELEQQLKEEGDSLEGSFVHAALELLKGREKALDVAIGIKKEVDSVLVKRRSSNSIGSMSEKSESSSVEDGPEQPSKNEDILEYADAFADEVGEAASGNTEPVQEVAVAEDYEIEPDAAAAADMDKEDGETKCDSSEDQGITAEEATEELAMPVEPKKRPFANQINEAHYYYQAADGQHIYLNSINTRIILAEYGTWENCPDTISATIIEMEGVTMTEDLRKRLRYLSHMPLTCQFQYAELALKPPLVSSATLGHFSAEIEKRQKMRQRRLREERQRSRRIRIEENRIMGIHPGMRVHITPSEMVRGPSPVEQTSASNTPIGSPPGLNSIEFGSPPGLNPNAAEFAPGSPVSVGSFEDGQYSSMSFAQMLRAGKAKPQVEAWPKIKGPSEGIVAAAPKVKADSDDSDCEDKAPVPIFQSSFGDAIEQALNKFKKLDVDVEEPIATTGISAVGSKRKKGKKKQLLFTTSMQRN